MWFRRKRGGEMGLRNNLRLVLYIPMMQYFPTCYDERREHCRGLLKECIYIRMYIGTHYFIANDIRALVLFDYSIHDTDMTDDSPLSQHNRYPSCT